MGRFFYVGFMMIASLFVLSAASSIKAEDASEVSIGVAALTNAELFEARARGGLEMLSFSDSDMDADLMNNVVEGANTGNNSVSHGSFSEMNGFGVVVQNSGNHVIIQNSTIVNVTMQRE